MKEKVIHYSVTQEKSTVTVPLNKKFLNEIESDKIASALEKYFFASVMEISTNQLIKDYANIAYSMTNFDFIKAKGLIDNLILDNPNKDFSDLSRIVNDARNYYEKRIEELFYTAIIKIKQKQYVDALLRLYNFIDNLLLSKVCQCYNLEYRNDNDFFKWWNKSIEQIVFSNPDIEDNLEKINNQKADLKRSGVPLYKALLRFKEKENRIFDIIEPILEICELRNKSIGAHGFESVSLTKIEDKLKIHSISLNDFLIKIESILGYSFNS